MWRLFSVTFCIFSLFSKTTARTFPNLFISYVLKTVVPVRAPWFQDSYYLEAKYTMEMTNGELNENVWLKQNIDVQQRYPSDIDSNHILFA